jgi:predicted AAA+ superfamily ATPase
MIFQRHIESPLLDALADTPVVLLHGARQTGKSTLARSIAAGKHPATYLTLDDAGVLAAARSDPAGFIGGLSGPVVLDEIQRAPEIFLAIKAAVDRDRKPGRFLLTGSANVLLLPRLSDSLAGRMEILTLWPLSQGEIEGVREGFLDLLFSSRLPDQRTARERPAHLVRRMLRGGYPGIGMRISEQRQKAWFGSYITTILQRDVRDLANIEGLTTLPRLMSLLATRAASLLNVSELSRSFAMPMTTLKRYLALLETTFLIQMLPPWSNNLGKRLVKTPRLVLADSGLMSYLLGLTEQRLDEQPNLLGPLLENFVIMELQKQLGWSRAKPQLFHFRTQVGQEVDIVLEDSAGRVVGVEVKATSSVTGQDFKGLRALAELLGRRFLRGVLLYRGSEIIPFGPKLHALPMNSLWTAGSTKK